MHEAHIKQVVAEALSVEAQTITNIRRTPGGMTNKSYFVTVNDNNLVVRISGAGAEELVNRTEEKDNLLYGTYLGINPPLLYFNAETGLKITKKIEGSTPVTPAIARKGNTMVQIIHLFKPLHNSTTPMKNDFKLFELIKHYELLINDVSDVVKEKLDILKRDIIALRVKYKTIPVTQVPCHIDPDCSNLIKSKNDEMYLIDWEYSGMFDPMWDIATIFISLDLEEEKQFIFLQHYLARKPTKQELQRILMHKIFQDYLWCLWSIFKDAQGDDVGGDVMIRFNRATENILIYKKNFEKEIVV